MSTEQAPDRSSQQLTLHATPHRAGHAGSHRQQAASASPRSEAAPGSSVSRWGFPGASILKAFGAAVLVPLFLGFGMTFAYLGAFHAPTPHHLPVAVVGTSAEAQVFAQKLTDSSPDELSVRTVPTAARAEQLIRSQTITAAYAPSATSATLYVSTADSNTSAEVAQKIFLPIAYAEKLPFTVHDVVSTPAGDSTGQGFFFLLVGLSVGSYATAAAVAAFASKLGIRWSIVTAVVMSGIVTGIAMTIAGPVLGVVTHGVWATWLMAWLYSVAIILIGVGLHPVLRHWTTAALTMLFVMLNFTSSGGIFARALMPGFFAALNTFWNGAAWLDAAQSLAYYPRRAFGFDLLRLGVWAVVGLGLVLLTHLLSRRRTRIANESVATTEAESVIAA